MDRSVEDIRIGLRAGRYTNEASVSQGIVLRLLSELGWPAYDTSVVWPEYSLMGRRVDFALCHPPGKPLIYIEVKQVGQGTDAERQLFEYAFHQGIPLAILTTGQEWHFFLPAERGDYDERRVYKLDLLERDLDECSARLKRYLDFRSVRSGDAIEAARTDYRSIAKDREILRTFPEAWRKLVEDGDELLLKLLADKVESLCGFRPGLDAAAEYLARGMTASTIQVQSRSVRRVIPPHVQMRSLETGEQRRVETDSTSLRRGNPPRVERQSSEAVEQQRLEINSTGHGFILKGQAFSARSGRDLLIQVFNELSRQDASFLERFSAHTEPRTKRRYLARSREGLYPGSERLAVEPSLSRELQPGSGWWIDLNLNLRSIEKVIEIACNVANLDYGVELEVILPNPQ